MCVCFTRLFGRIHENVVCVFSEMFKKGVDCVGETDTHHTNKQTMQKKVVEELKNCRLASCLCTNYKQCEFEM